MEFYDCPIISGNFIIPTDEVIFFRGGATTNQLYDLTINKNGISMMSPLKMRHITRSILDGYFNSFSLLVSMGISTNQEHYFFAGYLRLAMIILGKSWLVAFEVDYTT